MKTDDLIDPQSPTNDAPQGDGFDAVNKPRKRQRWKQRESVIRAAGTRAANAAACIVKNFPRLKLLSKKEMEKIVNAFRRVLCPPRKAGRPQSARVTNAWQDWKNGVKHSTLYFRHIPEYESLSDAERALEARKLMSAVRKRQRRADAELGLPLTPSP